MTERRRSEIKLGDKKLISKVTRQENLKSKYHYVTKGAPREESLGKKEQGQFREIS